MKKRRAGSFAGRVTVLHQIHFQRIALLFARIVLTCQRGNKTFSVENAVGLLHKRLGTGCGGLSGGMFLGLSDSQIDVHETAKELT